jgi:hypothetical protein
VGTGRWLRGGTRMNQRSRRTSSTTPTSADASRNGGCWSTGTSRGEHLSSKKVTTATNHPILIWFSAYCLHAFLGSSVHALLSQLWMNEINTILIHSCLSNILIHLSSESS